MRSIRELRQRENQDNIVNLLTWVPKEKLVCLHCSKVIECKMNVLPGKEIGNSQPCKFRDAVKVKVL